MVYSQMCNYWRYIFWWYLDHFQLNHHKSVLVQLIAWCRQATWTNVGHVICGHMASLVAIELIYWQCRLKPQGKFWLIDRDDKHDSGKLWKRNRIDLIWLTHCSLVTNMWTWSSLVHVMACRLPRHQAITEAIDWLIDKWMRSNIGQILMKKGQPRRYLHNFSKFK